MLSAFSDVKKEFSSAVIKKIVDLLVTSIFLFLSGYVTKILVSSKSLSSPFGLNKDVLSVLFIFISLVMLVIVFNKIKTLIVYLNEKKQTGYTTQGIDPDLYHHRNSEIEEIGKFYYEVEYGFSPKYDELEEKSVLFISEPLCPHNKNCYTEMIEKDTFFKKHKFHCPFCSNVYKSEYSSDTLRNHASRILNKKLRDQKLKIKKAEVEQGYKEFEELFGSNKSEEDPFK